MTIEYNQKEIEDDMKEQAFEEYLMTLDMDIEHRNFKWKTHTNGLTEYYLR